MANLGLVQPAEVKLIEDAQVMPDGSEEGQISSAHLDISDDIGNYVYGTLFTFYRNARRNEQEDILLDCERAYHNKYNLAQQSELATRQQESGDSTIWVPFSRPKANIAIAKTFEKMLNTSSVPWSVVPDELDPSEQQQNMVDVITAMQAGVLQEDPQAALKKLNEYTEKLKREKCDKMEEEIAEQMNKGDAFKAIARTIMQQHYLGTGIAKFEISVKKEEKWVQGPQGWVLEEKEAPFPKTKFCSLFDIFYDPYAKSIEESNGVVERHVVKRSDLLNYKEGQGFNEDKIKQIIENNPEGNHIDLDYETTIRGINEQDQNVQKNDNYFDVYEAWVELPGDKLINYGMTDKGIEPTGAYRVNCWVCDNVTIKLILNPHTPQKIPYFSVPYQENTHTIYGTGVCEELFGPQDVINSVTRATIDNAAFAHGPMTEINVDLLKSGERPADVTKPRQIILREGGDPKDPAVRYYQPTENSGVLLTVYDMFTKIGEDATGVSNSTEESMPAANAANMAVSMSLSQKNILQRTVVANIDTYLIKPLIEMYYNFNMKWNDREEIKSPAKITANGVTSIIAKEMRAQQLMAFAQLTNNELDAGTVDRKEVLEELATTLDQDGEKFVLSEEQIQENQQQQGQMQAQAAEIQQKGVIQQINAENQGQLEQERVKSAAAMRKQELIERSKLMQIGAKQQMELEQDEINFINQLRLGQQQQANTERNMLNQHALGAQQNENTQGNQAP